MNRERIVFICENDIVKAFTTNGENYKSIGDIMKNHGIESVVSRMLWYMKNEIEKQKYNHVKEEFTIDTILGTVEVVSHFRFNY